MSNKGKAQSMPDLGSAYDAVMLPLGAHSQGFPTPSAIPVPIGFWLLR